MVSRCGFYVYGDVIVERIVKIDWDLGFDRDAKHKYIERIKSALGSYVGTKADVTTASQDYKARRLSPIFLKCKDKDMSVEDCWQQVVKDKIPNASEVRGLFDYVYLYNFSDYEIDVAMEYDCYIDVFHNPDRGFHNTQARSLAVLRLIIETGQEQVLESLEGFLQWYKTIKWEVEYV